MARSHVSQSGGRHELHAIEYPKQLVQVLICYIIILQEQLLTTNLTY